MKKREGKMVLEGKTRKEVSPSHPASPPPGQLLRAPYNHLPSSGGMCGQEGQRGHRRKGEREPGERERESHGGLREHPATEKCLERRSS